MPALCELHVDLPGFIYETSESLNILLQMCFRSSEVLWNGSEECQKQEKNLASTPELHPHCTVSLFGKLRQTERKGRN